MRLPRAGCKARNRRQPVGFEETTIREVGCGPRVARGKRHVALTTSAPVAPPTADIAARRFRRALRSVAGPLPDRCRDISVSAGLWCVACCGQWPSAMGTEENGDKGRKSTEILVGFVGFVGLCLLPRVDLAGTKLGVRGIRPPTNPTNPTREPWRYQERGCHAGRRRSNRCSHCRRLCHLCGGARMGRASNAGFATSAPMKQPQVPRCQGWIPHIRVAALMKRGPATWNFGT